MVKQQTRIRFTGSTGKMQCLYLTGLNKKQVAKMQWLVSELNSHSCTGTQPSAKVMDAAHSLSFDLQKRLVRLGLLSEPSVGPQTLLGVFDQYMEAKAFKGRTVLNKEQAKQRLLECYGEVDTESIDGDVFVPYLQEQKLSGTTINRFLKDAKACFAWATNKGLVEDNPFAGLRVKEEPVEQVYVEDATIEKVMAHCDLRWRTILALARYGGLRTPSETLNLKWSDVVWDKHYFIVRSPKTGTREVPIHKRLRTYLLAAKDESKSEFVLDPPQGSSYRKGSLRKHGVSWGPTTNLQSRLCKILARAGVDPWPKLFNSLRGSCEAQLIKDDGFPEYLVQKWMGHSREVARKHYLKCAEDDFRRAAGVATKTTTTTPIRGDQSPSSYCPNPGQEVQLCGIDSQSQCLNSVQPEQFESLPDYSSVDLPRETGASLADVATKTATFDEVLRAVGSLRPDQVTTLLALPAESRRLALELIGGAQ